MAERSRTVGRRLGVTGFELERIEWAARAHDVGKIIVSPELLEKPGPLTNWEYEEVQRTPSSALAWSPRSAIRR